MAINVPQAEVGSFLAFLYRIRFDPTIHDAFHNQDTTEAVMDAFQLTAEEKQVVYELDPAEYPGYEHPATDGAKAQKWAELVALLLPEFYDWTYNHNPPFWW